MGYHSVLAGDPQYHSVVGHYPSQNLVPADYFASYYVVILPLLVDEMVVVCLLRVPIGIMSLQTE